MKIIAKVKAKIAKPAIAPVMMVVSLRIGGNVSDGRSRVQMIDRAEFVAMIVAMASTSGAASTSSIARVVTELFDKRSEAAFLLDDAVHSRVDLARAAARHAGLI